MKAAVLRALLLFVCLGAVLIFPARSVPWAIAESVSEPDAPFFEIGDSRSFYVIRSSTSETISVEARLLWLGDHLALWADCDVSELISESVAAGLSDFDRRVYPFMHEVFGWEASPGVDGDTRIHALVTDKIGIGILGYFSSRDSFPPDQVAYSNGMELILLSDSLLRFGGERIVNTLAHEFQHMIHFHHDANEGSPFDEGFSGFAEELAGERFSDAYEAAFFRNPDTSLTVWRTEPSALPSYGATYLFTKYIVDRLGLGFLLPWGEAQSNGFDGLDEALTREGIRFSADELYLGWLQANLALARRERKDVGYRSFPRVPAVSLAEMVKPLPCETGRISGSTEPYGAVYYDLDCPAGSALVTVRFDPEAPIVAFPDRTAENDENAVFWSGGENNSAAALTRFFSLPDSENPIRLDFWIVYDLEDAFDYFYLSVSRDEGVSWETLPLAGGSSENRSGFNLGNGLTGRSGGWREISVDLSAFAGERIALKFETITDQAVSGDGVMLDDIRIEALDFFDSAETGGSGWISDGFRITKNRTPLPFGVIRRTLSENKKDAVYSADLVAAGAPFQFVCDFASDRGSDCIFALTAMSRISREAGNFAVDIAFRD